MSIEVHIGWQGQTHLAGRLHAAERGSSVSFEYATEWLQREDAFAIDPTSLPLQRGAHHGKALFGAIQDCGPDRWGRILIERAVRKRVLAQKPYRDVDYVLALDDVARVGALRFRLNSESPFLAVTTGKLPPLVRLNALLRATDAIHSETETAQDLRFLLGAGSPLGGARPKSAVILADERLAIAKFPKPDDTRDIAAGEILALTLAAQAGIQVAEHQLVPVGGNSVAVITRFDRAGTNRIPFISAVTLLGLPLAAGTNDLTVTATDAAGNVSVTNLYVVQSSVNVTIDPISDDQLNQSSVNVTGTISDPSGDVCIQVNGTNAYYLDDMGDWEADGIVVSPTGTAVFDMELYTNDPVKIGGQIVYQPQPAVISLMSYVSHYYSVGNQQNTCNNGSPGHSEDQETVNWLYQSGGMDSGSGSQFNIDSCETYSSSVSDGLAGGYNGYSPTWEIEAAGGSSYSPPPEGSSGSWSSDVHARVMIVPSGQQAIGQTALYLVQAQVMDEDTGLQLPGSDVQIRGQTLMDVTNSDASVWSEALVSAPAGATNVEVTPQAVGNISFNRMRAAQLNLQLAVDASRDGNFVPNTPASPFRFWINDSKEHGDDESSEGGSDDQIPGASTPNCNTFQIQGSSDVVNFFPVALSLGDALQLLSPTNGFEYHLSQADGAANFVYASLTPTNAFDYLTNTASFGYGTNADQWATNAAVIPVPALAGGVKLDANWLAQVQANGGTGIILVEGYATSTQPLMLEIWRNGEKLTSIPLYLSISGVEQMFRHANFCYINGTIDTNNPSRATAPNEPATENKNLVFLHGYNVNQQEARGVESEMFKRFYWSGSKARFYGVTWNGAESKGTSPFYNLFTPDYHTNVVNALDTASAFATFLGYLSGQTVVVAHSLGNMVVLSAISDYNSVPSAYFMLDAAVPIEAVQGDTSYNPNMLYSSWNPYANRLFASDWWQLFPTNDYRSALTWSNRLGNLGSVDIYNFYSSGEEVLREYDSDPPSTVLSGAYTEWVDNWNGLPYGTFAWVWQEKSKGICGQDWFLGSSHGGWLFNDDYNDENDDLMSPSLANVLPNSELQTNAFFDFDSSISDGPSSDVALLGSSGSTYAQANRDRILSDAIPALTLPVGANPISALTAVGRNFDMQTSFETGWPSARTSADDSERYKWHHSDFDYVAYPFTHTLFEEIVNAGNLK